MTFEKWWEQHIEIYGDTDYARIAKEAWQAALSWQPIETAPLGKFILVLFNGGDDVRSAELMRYQEDEDVWYDSDDEEIENLEPTHWMPMPPEPKKEI